MTWPASSPAQGSGAARPLKARSRRSSICRRGLPGQGRVIFVQRSRRRRGGQARDPFALRSETYETARLRHRGYDIYDVERAWRDWAKDKETPRDPDRAFLAFFRTYATHDPL